MTSRGAHRGTSIEFVEAVAGLARVRLRPEVVITEIPAPQRIAPHSAALSAEIIPTLAEEDAEPPASGRFIILHDPSAPEAWEGTWRIVSFTRAVLEPELAGDPLLGEVGWSWLTDSLHSSGAAHHALGGTVTRVVSESFGALGDTEPSVEMEVRASWTPDGDDLPEHLRVWTDLMCTVAGLPPLPEGVTALPSTRR
ncbi:DUF3000 domain-containing protein [Gephyromycinifex aptenodytis]|uniref:DUF3000 domain-containing protein n=1 Tax=Gephyromycinifex aptenodytis TaxID=2716227 RepID=UPI0014451701|nr:DUF3000 domain-containing protein [Gephyromycinifex aptenodytis]